MRDLDPNPAGPRPLLAALRALADVDPARGLHLYAGYDAEPTFTPFAAFPGIIAAHMDHYRALGLEPGARVVLPFETTSGLIFSFFALLGLGVVPLSVKPRTMASPREAYVAFVRSVAERHGAQSILAAPCLSGVELPLRQIPLPTADQAAAPHGAPLPDRPLEELAFVQFSSGTTSTPKGVPITHAMLAKNLRLIQESDGRQPDEPGTSWLPLYHDMGLIGGLLSALYTGNDLHLTSPTSFLMDSLGWLRHLSARKVRLTVLPNFAIDYTLRALRGADPEDLKDLRFDHLRFIYLGSEPINIDNLLAFSELLAPYGFRAASVKPCYGMAEAVLVVTCVGRDASYRLVEREGGRRAISVGRPCEGYVVRVRNEQGEPCRDGELGEIELRGGSLASGYFEDDRPFLNQDGYYATGDLGFIDGGELFISGRVGDRFKVNAQSYFASDFEQVLETLPFTRPGRAAAIQVAGRIVVLIEVIPREAQALDPTTRTQVTEALVRAFGIKVPPEDVLFVRTGQIERTSSGKIRRHAIAQAYETGRLRLAKTGADGAGTDDSPR